MKLNDFDKKKEFLICVDSDGCAIDTMDIKHIRCFGPCMVEEWGLKKWESPILKRWNDINLYTMTRGINRFKGLVKILREIDGEFAEIDDLDTLENWVKESDELSNAALANAIRENESISLKKALSWSVKVNEKINSLSFEDKKPFNGVGESLKSAHGNADVAIVSSANYQAVEEEWEYSGLLAHVDILLAQDTGSKAFCIQELLKKGYEKECVLMVGDAPGDYEAARKNGVLFFPIRVRHEDESWEEFSQKAVPRFLNKEYQGVYQEEKLKEFIDNLSAGSERV